MLNLQKFRNSIINIIPKYNTKVIQHKLKMMEDIQDNITILSKLNISTQINIENTFKIVDKDIHPIKNFSKSKLKKISKQNKKRSG